MGHSALGIIYPTPWQVNKGLLYLCADKYVALSFLNK